MVERARVAERRAQTNAGAMNSDLRCRQRAVEDAAHFGHAVAFEITQDQCGAIVRRQAVDDIAYTAVHLVDDQALFQRAVIGEPSYVAVGARHGRGLARRSAKMVRGGTGRDGECPGLEAGTAVEAGQCAVDTQQGIL